MKALFLSSAILLVLGSSAFAADAVVSEPTAYSWSGVYVGGTLGYGWGKSHHFTEAIPFSNPKFFLSVFLLIHGNRRAIGSNGSLQY